MASLEYTAASPMAKKKILITGAAGFIGKHLVGKALKEGYSVRAFDFPEKVAQLKSEFPKIEGRTGDLLDGKVQNELCAKVDVVVHTAAIVKETGKWQEFKKMNIELPVNLAHWADHNKVKTFVHLSSIAVYGFHPADGVSEDGPLSGDGNFYCQSKIECEEQLLKQKTKAKIIIIRPGDVYGPGSVPWVIRPLGMMKKGLFSHIGREDYALNLINIHDLVDAIFLAIQKSSKADRQPMAITDGKATLCRDYFDRLALAGGLTKQKTLPKFLVFVISYIAWGFSRLFRFETDFNPHALGFILKKGRFSNERARKLLGFKPKVTLDKGMAEIENWLAQR